MSMSFWLLEYSNFMDRWMDIFFCFLASLFLPGLKNKRNNNNRREEEDETLWKGKEGKKRKE